MRKIVGSCSMKGGIYYLQHQRWQGCLSLVVPRIGYGSQPVKCHPQTEPEGSG